MRAPDFWPFVPCRLAAAGRDFTVLIADEDPRVRGNLEKFLSRRGCYTFFASDGTRALRCLTLSREPDRSIGHVDVVIADADLPGRSGIDILMAAKANAWDVAVVLTSTSHSEALNEELLRLGAAAVLAKPVALAELEKVLRFLAEERAPAAT
jgi:DNA-binding response OmpR family regulator